MMRILRSFLCVFCFIVFGIGGILIGLGLFPVLWVIIGRSHRQMVLINIVHYVWRMFVELMILLRLINVKFMYAKNIRKMRGNIIVANHPSLIDVVILVAYVPKSVCVVKGNLFRNPFVRYVIRNIYLSNEMTPDDFVARASKFLDNGCNIIIFPEGTRTIPGHSVRLHRGFAYLHLLTRRPIIPVQIKNNPHILGKKQPWWNVGTRRSIYNIKFMNQIIVGNIQNDNMRKSAVDITKNVKCALFDGQVS